MSEDLSRCKGTTSAKALGQHCTWFLGTRWRVGVDGAGRSWNLVLAGPGGCRDFSFALGLESISRAWKPLTVADP